MNEVELEGDIQLPGVNTDENDTTTYNTLDEPVRETIMRDIKAVSRKFGHVLFPKESKVLLREWDLWGPLLVCVSLALMLQSDGGGGAGKSGPEFAELFIIYWVGAFVVTLNAKLLGRPISIFQSVSVLGYCVLPLTLSLVICKLVLLAQQTTLLFFIRVVVVLVAFIWSTLGSKAFLASGGDHKRRALEVYPIFLFYFFISWLIISHTS